MNSILSICCISILVTMISALSHLTCSPPYTLGSSLHSTCVCSSPSSVSHLSLSRLSNSLASRIPRLHWKHLVLDCRDCDGLNLSLDQLNHRRKIIVKRINLENIKQVSAIQILFLTIEIIENIQKFLRVLNCPSIDRTFLSSFLIIASMLCWITKMKQSVDSTSLFHATYHYIG